MLVSFSVINGVASCNVSQIRIGKGCSVGGCVELVVPADSCSHAFSSLSDEANMKWSNESFRPYCFFSMRMQRKCIVAERESEITVRKSQMSVER